MNRLSRARTSINYVSLAAVAVLTWPRTLRFPALDLESSWQFVATKAAERNLFGKDFVLTYGPLGFLDFDRPFSYRLFIIAFIYTVVVQVLLVALVYRLVGRIVTKQPARTITTALLMTVLRTVNGFNAALAVITAAYLIDRAHEQRPLNRREIAAAGLLAGFGLTVKINEGLSLSIVTLIFLSLQRWCGGGRRKLPYRDVFLFVGVAGCAYAALWVGSGLSIARLPVYARRQLDLIRGYPRVTAYDEGHLSADVLVFGVIALQLAWLVARRRATAGRWTAIVALLAAVPLIFAAKHDFNTHTRENMVVLFAELLLVALAVAPREPRELALAALAPIVVTYISLVGGSPITGRAPRQALTEVKLIEPGRFDDRLESSRLALRHELALPPEYVTRLTEGGRAAFVSGDDVVAWAYPDIMWTPLQYPAHAVAAPLKHALNRELFDPAERPDLVLFREPNFRNTLAVYYPPSIYAQLLCEFAPLPTRDTTPWLLLAKRPANACGPETLVADVRAPIGDDVPIPQPAPDRMVVARFDGTGGGLREALRTAAFRPYLRSLSLDRKPYRFNSDAENDPHLVRLPPCLENLLDPLRVGRPQTLRVSASSRPPSTYRVRFYEIPIECP